MKTMGILKRGIFFGCFLIIFSSLCNPAECAVFDKDVNEETTGPTISTENNMLITRQEGDGVYTIKGDGVSTIYEAGKVIIKLKELGEHEGQPSVFSDGYSARKTRQEKAIGRLKAKHGLTNAKPVFKALHKKLESTGISLDELRGRIESKYPKRKKTKPRYGKKIDLLPIYIFDTDKDVTEVCSELEEDPDVEYAEPNFTAEVLMVPTDPYYHTSGSWGQPYDDLWGLKKIQCEGAWDKSQGEGAIVAVIDTGVDYTHQDLAENIWLNEGEIPDNGLDDDGNGYVDDIHGYDFAYGDPEPTDRYGHGTHCAGTIAAVGNNVDEQGNPVGLIGVAPKAKIMVLKGLGDTGSGYYDDLVLCVTYAADNGADVLSNSWGGSGTSQLLTDAFDYAHSLGCISVAAAGNSNADVSGFNPANIKSVIAVSAFTQNDERCSFSNYGALIDVAAPGGGYVNELGGGWNDIYNILSTMPDDSAIAASKPDLIVSSGYWRLAGTSMACPHVAGLAALLVAQRPDLTNNEIRQVIRASADDVGDPGWDIDSGCGRINSLNAMDIGEVCVGEITSPNDNEVLSGLIEIYGTATGTNFASYTLEYWEGTGDWLTIATFTTPVENGKLGDFDTLKLGQGRGNFYLRVNVIDTIDREFVSIPVVVYVKNLEISNVAEADIFRAGENIEVRGIVSGKDLDHYVIEYCDPGQGIWKTDGVVLTNGGTQGVTDGVLGYWNTAGLTEAPYLIRLTSYRTTGYVNSLTKKDILVSHLIREGWPIKIDYNVESEALKTRFWVKCFYVVDDIDGDSLKEIIVIVSGNPGRIFVYNHDGTLYPGWPVEVPITDPDAGFVLFTSTPVLGDIDLDGKKEILIAFLELKMMNGSVGRWENCDVYAYNHNGTPVSGWDFDVPDASSTPNATFAGQMAVANLDLVGNPEVIFYGRDRYALFITDNLGNIITALDTSDMLGASAGSGNAPKLAIGNIDADDFLEIVFHRGRYMGEDGLYHQNTYAVNMDGSIVPGWPVDLVHHGRVTLSDVDNDGKDEVLIAGGMTQEKGAYIIDDDGTPLPGWPQLTDKYIFAQVVSADLDNDGDLEVIAAEGGTNYIFHHDGSSFTEERVYLHDHVESPILADVTGDNVIDIIAVRRGHRLGEMSAYDIGNMKKVNDFPHYAPRANNPPTVSDLDNDGTLEVINLGEPHWHPQTLEEALLMNGIRVIVWDLGIQGKKEKLAWPMWRHDAENTGRYTSPEDGVPVAPANLSAIPASSDQIDLIWQDSSSGEAGFKIERGLDLTSFEEIATVTANTTLYNDTGLDIGIRYYYRIRAYNDKGDSEYSNTASATTIPLPPAAPSSLGATVVSYEQVDLEWIDNSDNEEGFAIERSEDGIDFLETIRVPADTTAYSDLNAVSNTTYYYRVRAYNGGGDSSYSNMASVTTPPGPPAPPSDLTALPQQLQRVFLSWNDNSKNETGFKIYRSEDGNDYVQVDLVVANKTWYWDSNLAYDTAYYYKVCAYNDLGNSRFSNVAEITTLPPPPAAPSDLTAETVSSHQIELQWVDNSNDEIGFYLERSEDNVFFELIVYLYSDTTSYSDTGGTIYDSALQLQPDTTYYYRVKAYNDMGGYSAYSNTASATTFPGPPIAPSQLSAQAVSPYEIDLFWQDNSKNELGFKIERSLDGGSFTQIAITPADTAGYNDTSVIPKIGYSYRVRAYNDLGDSEFSNEASVTTPPLPPEAPSDLTATAASSREIDLRWIDNSDNEDIFILERSEDNIFYEETAWLPPDTTEYSDGQHIPGSSPVEPGKTYYYKIRAINYGGYSEYSDVASATTPTNAPPVADDQSITADEDTPLGITLTGSDPDGDLLTFIVLTQPVNGTFSGDAPNLTYTPKKDFNGDDPFTFMVNDGDLDSNIATVSIAVEAVNDAPVLAPIGDKTVNSGDLLAFIVSATDVENDLLAYGALNLPIGSIFVPLASMDVNFDGNIDGTDVRMVRNNQGSTDPRYDLNRDGVVNKKDVEVVKGCINALESAPPYNISTDWIFLWKPERSQIGTHDVAFEIDDGNGEADSETIVITVKENPKSGKGKPHKK